MTRIFVPGIAAPQGSKTGFVVNGRAVLKESSDKVKPWREAVAKHAKGDLLEGPLVIEVEFVMPRTKAMGTKPAPPMVQRPDLDKLIRSTFDGLTGAAYKDDSQVVEVHASKRRAKPDEPTGAHITITPLNEAGFQMEKRG